MATCKIVIKDPSLAKVLGAGEFETYADFENALRPGDELLVSDKQGHFIAKFRKFAFTPDGKLKILFDSPRGEARIDEFIGKATPATLKENADGLDALAKSRLIEAVPDTTPTNIEEQAEPSAPKSIEAIYDSMDSKVKMEQFESTTGQDVKNEFEGTLDDRPSILPKMALRHAISENPQKYRLFVVADSSSYFNDEGIEPTGEVLLVVHAAAYESARAEKGDALSQQELYEVAVKMDGEKIVAEGSIYTLPLEGSLTGDAQFFERNHAERIEIYSDKYGVTPAQADAHFRAGEARMKDARKRARTAPVEVGLQSVSMGSYVNGPLPIDEFISNNRLTPSGYFKNTSKGKILGRVYFRATTLDGKVVEMLTVPKGVNEMYGAKFLWDTYTSGEQPEFLSSLFGNHHRPKGPYLKGGELFVNSRPITTFDEFVSALSQTDWPALSNKVDGGVSTVFVDGAFQQVPNDEFIKMHVETDGNLWTHQGQPVAYPANRYLYLNISGSKPAERVTSSTQNLDRATQDLFRDPREYDRIAASSDSRDVATKMMLPHLFSPAFLKSQSYPRLRKKLKTSPPQRGSIAIDYPVGGRYFGSKAVAKRKLGEVLVDYREGGLNAGTFEEVDAQINEQVRLAQQQGIELGTFEPEANALYTHFANAYVANAENQILYGNRQEINGVFPEIAPSWWSSQTEGTTQSTAFTELPETPSPVFRSLNTQLTTTVEGNYITYDAYRTLSKANGSWTEAQETEYQDHIADPNKKVEGGSVGAPEFSAESDEKFYYAPIEELLPLREFDRETETHSGPETLNKLTEDIRKNGIKNPITVEIYDGKAIVTEGNTILAAANRLGIKNIPVEVKFRNKDFGSGYIGKAVPVSAEVAKNGFTRVKPTTALPVKPLSKTVELAYSGPVNTKLDGDSTVQSFEQQNLPVRKFTIVGADSEIGRQMLSEGYGIATPEGKTMFAPYFYSPREAQGGDAFLESLESAPAGPVEKTEAYLYAETLLGKNFAQKLFSSGQPYTFADIEGFRADLGKPFSFTRFNARKDFAIYPKSEAKIASGAKTITLRDSGADYANRSGLVEIDGEVFDIQEVGNLTLRKALDATGMTQQEFAKAFLGEDTGIESIREESIKAFFSGEGTKRVFTIKKLGEPIDPRKRKSKKQIPC
jgi:hypothetical protein